MPTLIPGLAVEILSDGNTDREMSAKLHVYFEAGVRLVWYVSPETRTDTMWREQEHSIQVPADGLLDGLDVLPGLQISLSEFVARLGRCCT